MPEINQYSFQYREIVEALIKQANIHEGRWTLVMNFNLAGANVGSSPTDVVPAAIVGVTNIGLQKALPDSPAILTVDASTVNPAPSST